MTQDQEQQLIALTGKTINYKSKRYVIKAFKEVSQNIVMLTDSRTFNFLRSQIDELLEDIEVDPEAPTVFVPDPKAIKTREDRLDLSIFNPTDTQKEIQKSLVDMLQLVKADPKYIGQAKSVCEIANTLVNMERSQIDLMRLATKNK